MLQRILSTLARLAIALWALWTAAALAIDFHGLAAATFLAACAFALMKRSKGVIPIACGALTLLWFMLAPSNDRNWQTDVSRTPWAEIQGDTVTVHEVRNFNYSTETSYQPRWDSRQVKLSELKGIDLFVSHWGSPYIAHAIVSFDFGGGQYLAASVEARKEVGESYSAIRGFFRQFELIYLIADERDVVRLRTNYRTDEELRIYRTRMTAADSRALFLEYIKWMNDARRQPEWYNALTRNCTSRLTGFLLEKRIGGLSPWDWRLILNGKGEEMLYDLGLLENKGLGFEELQTQSLINETAKAASDDPNFSQRIRQGRPGF